MSKRKQTKPKPTVAEALPPVEETTVAAIQKSQEKQAVIPLSKEEAGKLRDGILDDLAQSASRQIEAALKFRRFVVGRGWEALGYESLTAWREAEVRFGEFYKLRRIAELIAAGVAEKDIRAIVAARRATNLDGLYQLYRVQPKLLTEGKWVEEARQLPIADFEAKVEKELVRRGAEPEATVPVSLGQLPTGVAEKLRLALKVAEEVDGAKNKAEAVEAIAANYLNAASDEPGKSKLQRYYELEAAETTEALN